MQELTEEVFQRHFEQWEIQIEKNQDWEGVYIKEDVCKHVSIKHFFVPVNILWPHGMFKQLNQTFSH